MTDAELITRLRADVDAHVMTGNGGMRRVEAIRLAADRLTQLSEDNERLVEVLAEARSGLCAHTGGPDGACAETIKRIDAAIAQGQKEGD